MIYATSDLHGCDPKRFYALLEKAGFCQQDFLFVLGDVIDRGDHGVELLRWMMDQTNVQLILGNHEAFFLSCLFAFQPVTEENLAQLSNRKLEQFELWLRNGGGPTVEALKKLVTEEPDVFDCLVDYVQDAPLYDVVEAGGQQFALVSNLHWFMADWIGSARTRPWKITAQRMCSGQDLRPRPGIMKICA